MFDIYSITHVFWPALMTSILVNIFGKNIYIPICAMIISIYFEIYENSPKQIVKYRRIEIDSAGNTTYRGDTLLNIIGDILFNIIGIYIGYTATNTVTAIILLILFIIVTSVTGITYWTDFLTYLSEYAL